MSDFSSASTFTETCGCVHDERQILVTCARHTLRTRERSVPELEPLVSMEQRVKALEKAVRDALVHLDHEHYGWARQSLTSVLPTPVAPEPESIPVWSDLGPSDTR